VLKDPSRGRLRTLIGEIVGRVVSEGQLSECDLTFKDLAQVEDALYQILLGVFSRRISYPGYTFDKEQDHDASRGAAALPPVKA
jgi:cyclic-di-AMP phosphodiesterase PgpH